MFTAAQQLCTTVEHIHEVSPLYYHACICIYFNFGDTNINHLTGFFTSTSTMWQSTSLFGHGGWGSNWSVGHGLCVPGNSFASTPPADCTQAHMNRVRLCSHKSYEPDFAVKCAQVRAWSPQYEKVHSTEGLTSYVKNINIKKYFTQPRVTLTWTLNALTQNSEKPRISSC